MVYLLIKDLSLCYALDRICSRDATEGSPFDESPEAFIRASLARMRQISATPILLNAARLFLALEAAYLSDDAVFRDLDHRPSVSSSRHDIKKLIRFSQRDSCFHAFAMRQLDGFSYQPHQISALLEKSASSNAISGDAGPSLAAFGRELSPLQMEAENLSVLLGISRHRDQGNDASGKALHELPEGVYATRMFAGPLERLGVFHFILSSSVRVKREREEFLREAALGGGGIARSSTQRGGGQCFHDYAFLMPVSLVKTILAIGEDTQRCGSGDGDSPQEGEWKRANVTRPSMSVFQLIQEFSRRRKKLVSEFASIIISPACTPLVKDGDDGGSNSDDHSSVIVARRIKNERLERIQQASSAYCYDRVVKGESARRSGSLGTEGGNIRPLYEQVFDMQQFQQYAAAFPDKTHQDAVRREEANERSIQGKRRKSRDVSGSSGIAAFNEDISLGVDMLVMLFSGAAIGYFLGALRGAEEGTRLLYALVGMTLMMLVDGTLLITRMRHADERAERDKNRRMRIWRKRHGKLLKCD